MQAVLSLLQMCVMKSVGMDTGLIMCEMTEIWSMAMDVIIHVLLSLDICVDMKLLLFVGGFRNLLL